MISSDFMKPQRDRTQRTTWSTFQRYTVCPKMPQNEERITFNSGSYKTVHFSHSLHQKLLHFPHLPLVIMASIAQHWVLIPRTLAALDLPGKNKTVRNACNDDFLE